MYKTHAVVVGLCVIVAACASVPRGRFVAADGTPASEKDIKECEYEQAKAVPESGGYGIYAGGAAPPIVKRCLELRGYRDTAEGALSYK